MAERGIETKLIRWGEPTVVIEDLDGNELFFWLSESECEKLRGEIDGPAWQELGTPVVLALAVLAILIFSPSGPGVCILYR